MTALRCRSAASALFILKTGPSEKETACPGILYCFFSHRANASFISYFPAFTARKFPCFAIWGVEIKPTV